MTWAAVWRPGASHRLSPDGPVMSTSVAPRGCWGWGVGWVALRFPPVPWQGGLLAEKFHLQYWGEGGLLSPNPSETYETEPTFIRPQLWLPWAYWEVLGLGARLRTG